MNSDDLRNERATASLSVAKPLMKVLGSNASGVKRALIWHSIHGTVRVAPLVIVALLAGRLIEGPLTTGVVWNTWFGMLAALIVAFGAAVAGNRFLYVGAFEVGKDLRYELVRKVRLAPVGDILTIPRGEVTTVIDRDVADVEQFLNSVLPNLTSALIAPLVLIVTITVIDPVVGIALVLASLLTALGYWAKLRAQALQSQTRRRLRASQDERIIEFVQGIEVAKAFGLRSEMASRLSESLGDYKDENLRSVRHTIPIGAGLKAGASFVGGVLLAIAGWRFSNGAMGSSEIAVLLILIAGTTLALLAVGSTTGALPGAAAALQRIGRILRLEEAPLASGGVTPVSHEVRFEGVEFSYQADEPILRSVSFEAPAGSVTAVTGESGAGKTTILHLLAGLWRPDAGRITIGGVDLSTLSPVQLNEIISIVLQEPYLPDGTIREAIAGGRLVDDSEIQSAATLARCWNVIENLPNGLETTVGEGGKRMSGGERQRIAIARALIADTPVVCLDEATAALDATTERSLQEAMTALLRDRTVLVVAHRPQTIKAADHIVVIQEGVVAESGTHDELMAANGVYSQRTAALETSSRRGFGRD